MMNPWVLTQKAETPFYSPDTTIVRARTWMDTLLNPALKSATKPPTVGVILLFSWNISFLKM